MQRTPEKPRTMMLGNVKVGYTALVGGEFLTVLKRTRNLMVKCEQAIDGRISTHSAYETCIARPDAYETPTELSNHIRGK